MQWYEIIGSLLMLTGSIFLFLGALGIVRMPDVYNRMQAGTKATTMGLMTLSLGVGIYHPEWLLKSILIIIFVGFTNPVASHALARASHKSGIPLSSKTVIDKYREDKSTREDKS